jgi:hypothetical protein
MELALILRELAERRRIVALGVVVAALAAILSVYRLDGLSLKPRALQHSSASTRALVDSSSSALGNISQSFEGLQSRATVYANFMASPVFLDMIGKRVGSTPRDRSIRSCRGSCRNRRRWSATSRSPAKRRRTG